MFSNEPDKRRAVINELKLFTKTDNVRNLVENLSSMLTTPNQRLLLNEIKYFIPGHHQDMFESLTKNKIYQSTTTKSPTIRLFNNESSASASFMPPRNRSMNFGSKQIPKGIR